MENGSISFADFADEFKKYDSLHCRVSLVKNGDSWLLRRIIADSFPSEAQWTLYDYGEIVFLNQIVSGNQFIDWINNQKGSLAGYSFDLPSVDNSIRWDRLSSYKRNEGIFKNITWTPEPQTLYNVGFNSDSLVLPAKDFPLIRENCPAFPDYETAVYRLLYNQARIWGDGGQHVAFWVRIKHTDAMISKVVLNPQQVSVEIQGDRVDGTRLVIGGTEKSLDEELYKEGEFTQKFDRWPNRLWILLAREGRLLDYRDLNLNQPYYWGWDNIIVEPESVCARVKEWIYQGESNSIEFKESLPKNDDKFVKTIAAFANAGGGAILIGVENGTGTLKGVTEDIGEYKDKITNMIRSKIVPHLEVSIEDCIIDHHTIVAVIVAEGNNPPYGITHGLNKPTNFYVRRNATTFSATQAEVQEISKKFINTNATSPLFNLS